MSDSEFFSFALKNALNEIRNACPDIKSTFMFKENGEIIAGDENTPEKLMARVVDAFDGILEKAEAIGGLEGIILEGSKGRVKLSYVDNLYLVTVTSEKADMNYVNTVTRVLIPTVLKMLEKIHPTSIKSASPPPEIRPEVSKVEKLEEPMKEPAEKTAVEEPKETLEPEIKPETLPIEPPVNQLIVENIGGLLVPSDTVRVDGETLSEWEGMLDGRKIEEVEIETFNGKTTRCKVKSIKDSKFYGKGIIQMPEKIQLALEIKKGELVRVKPVID
jgi:predicted regulator of Ras-like GTPase activity (Roadblock/LC7/MglB family)